MRALGIAIAILGLVVLGFGIHASQSVTEKVVEGVSGRYTEHTMWYILGGLAMLVGGGAMTMCSRCDRNRKE